MADTNLIERVNVIAGLLVLSPEQSEALMDAATALAEKDARIAELEAQVSKATDPAYLTEALAKVGVCDIAAANGWVPLTWKDDKATCPWPADETVVEVMLQDGTVCRAWHSCNIMDAGDWDFVPVDAGDEPDDAADSIASKVVAWRAALSQKETGA